MMTAPSLARQAESLAAGGRYADALQLLQKGCAAGDGDALLCLAFWRVGGTIIRRDLAAAKRLFAGAAAAGNEDAALLHAYFTANGTGGAADWPSALSAIERLADRNVDAWEQLRLVRRMDLDGQGGPRGPFQEERLSTEPWVTSARAFLTAAECDYLAAAAEPRLEPSVIVDPTSGRLRPHPVRTSDGAFFGVTQEDLVVSAVNRRIAALSGTDPAQGEPLQVLSYRPGAEYRAHVDAIAGAENQRIVTVLLYLNEGYGGGETAFLRTGLSFKGRKGDALLFRNVGAGGEPDPSAQHAGLPVASGRKVIASRWIRARPFSYPAPLPALEAGPA